MKEPINESNDRVSNTKTILKDIDKKFVKKKSKHKVLKILIGILIFYFVISLITIIHRSNQNNESYSQIEKTTVNQINNQTESQIKNQTERQNKSQTGNQVNNQIKSIVINEEVDNTSIEGTYIGENKSCLIMKADKTAKYYFYNVKKIENCTWDFNIEKSKIIIKWKNQDLFIDILIVDKYFLIYGGGIYWDDEKYEKISNNVTDFSIAKMNDMFFFPNEYHISILKSDEREKANDFNKNVINNNFFGVNFTTPKTWIKKSKDETIISYIPDEANALIVVFLENDSRLVEFSISNEKLKKFANAILDVLNVENEKNGVINENSFKISNIDGIKNCEFSFQSTSEIDNSLFEKYYKIIYIDGGTMLFIYGRDKNSKIDRYDDAMKIFDSISFDEAIIAKHNNLIKESQLEESKRKEEEYNSNSQRKYVNETQMTESKRKKGMDDPYIKFYNFCKAMCDELYNYGYKLDDWSQEIEEIEENVIEGTIKVKIKNKYGTWGNYTIHAVADFNNEKIIAWDLN